VENKVEGEEIRDASRESLTRKGEFIKKRPAEDTNIRTCKYCKAYTIII
jgi:hypothetical protein